MNAIQRMKELVPDPDMRSYLLGMSVDALNIDRAVIDRVLPAYTTLAVWLPATFDEMVAGLALDLAMLSTNGRRPTQAEYDLAMHNVEDGFLMAYTHLFTEDRHAN